MARRNNPRMRKINELIREIVAESVLDLKDPRIGFLTITGAETSRDLRQAIVYYSVLGTEDDKKQTADALVSAAPRIQHQIGLQTKLRYTPKVEFRVDRAIDEGLKIDQMVRELREHDEDHEARTTEPATDDEPSGGS